MRKLNIYIVDQGNSTQTLSAHPTGPTQTVTQMIRQWDHPVVLRRTDGDLTFHTDKQIVSNRIGFRN